MRYKKTCKPAKPVTAEAITRLADQGEDISRFFRQGRMVQPIRPLKHLSSRAQRDASHERSASREPALSEVEGDPDSKNVERVGVLRLVWAKADHPSNPKPGLPGTPIGPHSLSMTVKWVDRRSRRNEGRF